MNVLVTGAAGYIGGICAEALIRRGHAVIALDNLSRGHREAVPREADFVEGDVGNRRMLEALFASRKVDAVMHFAALSLVEESVREPATSYSGDIAHGSCLLETMVGHGVNKMVFSSSAAVYGEPETVPISEKHPTAPINPYGASKRDLERLLEAFCVSGGLRYVSLRYFNAAGASEARGENHRPETHVVPSLLEAALGQQTHFRINGNDYPTPDGTCVRDYVHVLDIAEASILALDHLDRISGQTFNVGSDHGYSVLEVWEAVQSVTRRPIPTVTRPRRPGDPATLVANSEKIRRELGWKPRFSDLDTIIKTAWTWKQKFPFGYPGKA